MVGTNDGSRILQVRSEKQVALDATKQTVLVLEDEPLIAIDIETTLRDAGCDVSIVGSRIDALEWLEVCRPDVVIVDILLTDGPSNEVAEQLILDDIPFVVHSGDIADSFVGTAFGHGRWLSKPCMPEELISAVRQLLSDQPPP